MRTEARLDSAVFQLTPTRTRCDLVIIANGKTEKLASGLLNPFLAHLKSAQDQIAKGGYSITLEPARGADAVWFTKGTVERFVRFVSTPEILERVTTIESEILQIEEAISIQGNDNLGLSTLEHHQNRVTECIEGSRPIFDADAEKAIVLYKPGSHQNPPDSNGSTTQEENSKVQLLRVLETRKLVLQKEQGMAFARATAAGFDMDQMAPLISFAECFGASRLMEACLRFMELWKIKHETGQWLEVEAAEAMSSRSEFCSLDASGIILTGDTRKQKEFGEAWPLSSSYVGTESNGKPGDRISPDSQHLGSDHNGDKRLPSDPHVPLGPHEYFQGHFQQPTFPQWPMHPPPGAPVFQPYPMQGMPPYYQNYPASGPYFQSPYPPMEDPRFNTPQRVGKKKHSMDSKDSNIESDDDDDENMSELERESSHGHKTHKRAGRSGKKKAGVVVIRNINYIASKKNERSGSESQSGSDSEIEEETEKKSSRSLNKKEGHRKSIETSSIYGNDEVTYGQEADSGNWQAFQSFLLRAEEKMTNIVDGDIFAGEKKPPVKKRQNISEPDPFIPPVRDSGNIHQPRITEFDSVNGKASRIKQAGSNDDLLTSRDNQLDAQFKEIEGNGRGYRRATSDDFLLYGRENQMGGRSYSDPLAEHESEYAAHLENSSHNITDDSFIVPFRSGLQDQLGTERIAIDMNSEFPSGPQRNEVASSKVKTQLSYEPDDLTLMPERGIERESIGYDPAKDYDIQVPLEVAVKQDTGNEEDNSTSTKEELKKSDKEKKLKVQQDGLAKRKKEQLTRRGISSKSNPLAEAQKRAEKLRAFKADLQKAKKDNEEEQRKRLEALKIERQKRIAARSTSTTTQSPSTPNQTKARLPTKLSPSSYKGSKFSDSEPGSNSPLEKLPIRNNSVGSKPNRSNGTTNGLSRSVSALPELKKESNGIAPEAKVASTRINRLSDPKGSNIQRASSQKSMVTDQIPKKNVTSEPQTKKISAIMQLDKTKSATLPELKIKTLEKGPGNTTSLTSESFPENESIEKPPRLSNSDDNPVVEKTVVMLETELLTAPLVHPSEGRSFGDDGGEKTGLDLQYAAINAPPSHIVIGEVEDSSECKLDDQPYEVVNGFSKNESQNISISTSTENSYQTPIARTTSLEDHATSKLDYSEAPTALISELATVRNGSVKALVSNFTDSNSVDQAHDSNEKSRSKESKGFRKLLKFGRKSHSSASGETNIDSDALSVDDHTLAAAASNDVHMLKNLISQDDTHTGGTPPKASRPFSLLSPFRSSKTNEKKQMA